MTTLQELEKEIKTIKTRNKLVEADKAWETSWARKVIVFALTYIVITLFFIYAELPKPFINSIVPAIGFILSSLSIPFFKKIWLKNQQKK